MANMNLSVTLNVYTGANASNSPSLRNLYWARNFGGLKADNPGNQEFDLAASGTITLTDKKFVYIESKKAVTITINGGTPIELAPFVIGSTAYPGIFMFNGTITTLVITNPSSTEAVEDAFMAWSE